MTAVLAKLLDQNVSFCVAIVCQCVCIMTIEQSLWIVHVLDVDFKVHAQN